MTLNEAPGDVRTATLLARTAERHPDRPFLVLDDGGLTYGQTADATWGVADWLVRAGVETGEAVSVWLPNGKELVLAWLGINAAGGVYAPLNVAYRGAILEHTINLAQSRVLVAHHELVPRLTGLNLPHLERLVVVGGDAAPSGLITHSWNEIQSSGRQRPQLATEPSELDDMALIYTSGTTGLSKAVRCSYTHHWAYGHYLFPDDLGPADRFYLCLPLFHVAATCGLYWMLRHGASAVVVSSFSPNNFWQDVKRLDISVSPIITVMSNMLVDLPPTEADADNPLRQAYVIPMIPRVQELADRFDFRYWSGYGMTEIPTVVNTGINPSNHRACGRLVDPENYEARIVDERDADVPVGEVGELIVRHRVRAALFTGYKSMPQETERAWRGGWFHTGDAFSQDEHGWFYFHDRKKDTIRRRGENISSFEVEREIRSHPAVSEVAVIPVPAENEDEVKAVICLQPASQFDPVQLVAYLAERLPYFMVPRYIEVTDELPKGPSLRVEKFRLRERGVTPETWDSVAAGVAPKRERLS